MQVVVDGLLTHYETRGTGKVVVLLHGWGDSSTGFTSLQTSLAEHYKVIALDLPGFGQSEVPNATWGLEEFARFVAHFLHKLHIKDVYVVVGHSNGGAIAICGVSNGVLRPEKLVLLASAGIRATGSLHKLSFKLLAKIGKVATLLLPKAGRTRLRNKLYSAAGSDMLLAPALEATFKKTVAQDVQSEASKITLPVLLMYGDQDTATPIWYGKRFHGVMSHSTLKVVVDAGHFIHLDQPQKVLSAVKDFLR